MNFFATMVLLLSLSLPASASNIPKPNVTVDIGKSNDASYQDYAGDIRHYLGDFPSSILSKEFDWEVKISPKGWNKIGYEIRPKKLPGRLNGVKRRRYEGEVTISSGWWAADLIEQHIHQIEQSLESSKKP